MRIFTLGTGKRTEAEISKIITKYQIQVLADIRRRSETLRREDVQRLCKEARAEYIYLGNELGSEREQGSLTDLDPDLRSRGISILKTMAKTRGLLILCTEETPERCNRRAISSELSKEGAEVIHLLDIEATWTPGQQRSQPEQGRDGRQFSRDRRDSRPGGYGRGDRRDNRDRNERGGTDRRERGSGSPDRRGDQRERNRGAQRRPDNRRTGPSDQDRRGQDAGGFKKRNPHSKMDKSF